MAQRAILQYQGKYPDPVGSFKEGLEVRGELQEQSQRQKMQGILAQMSDPREREAALMEGGHFDAASSVRQGVSERQEMGQQQAAGQREDQERKLSTIGSGLKTLINSVKGIEDIEEINEVYKMTKEGIEQRIMQAGGVPKSMEMFPWAALDEYSEDGMEMLQRMADFTDGMIQQGKDVTAQQRNFRQAQKDPEFAEFLKSQGSRSPEIQAWNIFTEENPNVSFSDFQSQYRKGITGASLTEVGITPIEGAAETLTELEKAKQTGKEEAVLDFAGRIASEKSEKAVTGKELGAAKAKLSDMEAAMPALLETADKLSKLAEAATYTMKGKAFNAAVRELGLEVSDAAAARAEMITTIDVDVLPMLKPTFGAAFTVREGDWLKATLGDPNLSPKEKQRQIKARVRGWEKELETLQRRVGGFEVASEVDLSAKSVSELKEMLKNAK